MQRVGYKGVLLITMLFIVTKQWKRPATGDLLITTASLNQLLVSGEGREELRQLAFYTCVAAETLGVCWCGSQFPLVQQEGAWVAVSANKTSCGVESAGLCKGCWLSASSVVKSARSVCRAPRWCFFQKPYTMSSPQDSETSMVKQEYCLF